MVMGAYMLIGAVKGCTPQLRVSKSGPGALDCQPNRSTFLRQMRFVAGRVHRGGEPIGKQLLAGALMRMAGVFLAEMQQLTPKEWQ